ncbi:hypothetical protein [Pseudomonas sp. R3-18-08]|uniref:hypothetical protein n=1 Tax=Pseudomonas sp. R3-18-08 TaxID=1173283 RepID=UPI000F565F4A|nr:hypothetical protein [Pseudomonas sp. R3-18-08]
MDKLKESLTLFFSYISEKIIIATEVMQAWVKDNGFWYQLSLSLFSALIFYIVFNVIPQAKRKSKLRLLIVRDLRKLRQDLFFLFCILIQENPYNSAGSFQHSITGGKLRRREMYLGVQNKCFEKDLLNDQKISKLLFPIDEALRKQSASAIEQIDKIFNLSEFASPKEIVLIEDIRNLINAYSLESSPSKFKPVISNCAYLIHAYYPLYLLFLKLTETLRKERCVSSSELYSLAAEYKDRGEYKKSLKTYKKAEKLGCPNAEIELQIAACYFHLNRKNHFRKQLKQAFENGPPYNSLVSCRHTIMEFSDDTFALEIIKRSASADQYNQMLKVIEGEEKAKAIFITQNLELSKYFSALSPGYQTVEQIDD